MAFRRSLSRAEDGAAVDAGASKATVSSKRSPAVVGSPTARRMAGSIAGGLTVKRIVHTPLALPPATGTRKVRRGNSDCVADILRSQRLFLARGSGDRGLGHLPLIARLPHLGV